MFDIAKIYLRSLVGVVSVTCGICYLSTVQTLSEPVLLGWLAVSGTMVVMDTVKEAVAHNG